MSAAVRPHRRVLIVSASMGGGHHAVTRELARRLSRRGHEVVTADVNDLMLGPTGGWLRQIYPWLVNRAPWLYDAIYRFFFLGRQSHGERVSVPTLLATPGLRRLISAVKPDVVVSTFHIAGIAAGRLRRMGRIDVPVATFITNFAVHNLWVHPGVDLHLCLTPMAAAEATLRSGSRAVASGPVVRPGFADPPDARAAVRRELGIAPDARVALVSAGSLGMGQIASAAAAIDADGRWTPVVVCGRNPELRAELEADGHGVVLEWVEDMARLMSAADVFVDNAAGLSAIESLCFGLPVVTFRPIAGHGKDNARTLARLGLTEVTRRPAQLIAALDRAAEPGKARDDRIARGRALRTGDAASEIERLASVPAGGGEVVVGGFRRTDGTWPSDDEAAASRPAAAGN